MADANDANTTVHPRIQNFVNDLAKLLQRDEKIFLSGSGTQQLEKVLLATDDLLSPDGNFILLNIDLTFKELFKA